MIVLVLAAGSTDAYEQAGSLYPKNLVELAGKPLLQHVAEWLLPLKEAGGQFVYLVPRAENERFFTAAVIRLMDPDAAIIEVPERTAGAACTALLAIEKIRQDAPLLVVNGDIVIDRDPTEFVREFAARSLDGGVVVFDGIHPRWSYVRLDRDRLVVEAAEKRPISRHATAGFHWFARGEDFVNAASTVLLKNAAVEGSFYIAPVFNELVLLQKSIGVAVIPSSEYHSLKDPADARKFEVALGLTREARG
jgi:NDP-sugar pyrophosphorylase family protein